MNTGSLFLGIDSSGGIDSAMELTPRRNRFLLDEKFFTVSKIEVTRAMGDSITHCP
jgi:hypothetical protein